VNSQIKQARSKKALSSHRLRILPQQLLTTLTVLVLAGCGGGGGSSPSAAVTEPPAAAAPPTNPTPTPTPTTFTPGQFEPASNFAGQCQVPRASDSQGTSTDENYWLRSWSNDLYLWYDEITDVDPALHSTPIYFDLMKTNATAPSGAPRDQFHFSIDTEEWLQLSQSGVSAGYGAELALLSATPPREIVVAFTEPNSPAAGAGLVRGTRILQVDGRDAVNGNTNADVDALNAGLFPSDVGETHSFLIEDPGTGVQRSITMVSSEIIADPVQNVRIDDTANGPVGYLAFHSHIATAEEELFAAMTTLEEAAVTELVLDMRYNGGGFLILANQLAAMIAGQAAASGRVFDELQFNDKHTVRNPFTNAVLSPDLFASSTVGLGDSPADRPLPALNLSRVFVLTGPGTCSASESIINGLRGIDVEVIQIGETTCGKPYGFFPTDNCGTTYFSVQFRGVNAKNFGDYADGFSPADLSPPRGEPVPGCSVADDFSKPLGDPDEARFAAALAYIDTGECPATASLGPAVSVVDTSSTSKNNDADSSAKLAVRKPGGMPGAVIIH